MWQYHLAAMISQLGCITLPQETLARAFSGQPLSDEDRRLYESHPEIAGKLLGTIPRLEAVAAHGRRPDAQPVRRARQG